MPRRIRLQKHVTREEPIYKEPTRKARCGRCLHWTSTSPLHWTSTSLALGFCTMCGEDDIDADRPVGNCGDYTP